MWDNKGYVQNKLSSGIIIVKKETVQIHGQLGLSGLAFSSVKETIVEIILDLFIPPRLKGKHTLLVCPLACFYPNNITLGNGGQRMKGGYERYIDNFRSSEFY